MGEKHIRENSPNHIGRIHDAVEADSVIDRVQSSPEEGGSGVESAMREATDCGCFGSEVGVAIEA